MLTLGYNLEASDTPQIPIAKSRIKPAIRPKCAIFPFLIFFGGRRGRESKSSIMIAALERIEWNSNPPIPIPPKTRIRHVKAKTCHLFRGDGGGGGGS